MVNAQELAARMVVVKAVKDRVAAEEARLKAALSEVMDPGDRKMAVVDGAEIGTVSRAKAGVRAVLRDEAALVEWCRANGHQGAIVEAVADWFKAPRNLLALIEKSGGEVPDGVDLADSGGFVSVRQSAAQEDALARLLAEGGVASLVAEVAGELEAGES